MNLLEHNVKNINSEMENVMDIMEQSVYGHKHAKNQMKLSAMDERRTNRLLFWV